jgi:PAS domain S-box-containing protein
MPGWEELLDSILRFGREVHLDMGEEQLVDAFLSGLVELFPRREVVIRVVDVRTTEPVRVYAKSTELRDGLETDRIVMKASSAKKTRLKEAVVESARVRLAERWESPFKGLAAGFSVPLVAAGELYGLLDIGYALGVDASEEDEPLVLPIANHLSVALRNQRLHRETTLLRDYQSRLIEHANALILGVGRDWRITVCNRALCRITGYERSELMGRDLRDWLPADQRGRLVKLFLQAMSGEQPDSIDVALPTKRGGEVRTVWSVAAVGRKGRIQALVGIGQDQTKLRDLQSQVIHAEKLATLGQLAAGVVHELNNPLTSISVYAEYLEKKLSSKSAEVDSSDVAKLKQIGVSARRIMAFARDLVQYAKPAGYDLESVDLNQVVRQSLSFCEHLFSSKRIELVEELGEELPTVLAVPGQLEQVVINLVTNAVHAVGEVGVIRVSTYCAGDRLVLAIGDSGPGIPEVQRPRVFEPFFTTKSDGKGTGLGLSIVRNITEQHSGAINVSKSDEGGALFTVTLPGEP